MDERTCGWCGCDISHKRSNAKYCSTQHKKNAGSKRHRERNPGYYARYTGAASRKEWAEANRERILAAAREYQQQYRLAHPGKSREWWQANPEKHRLYQAARRARFTEGFLVTERDVRRLFARHGGRCAYCRLVPATELDHVVPLKRGGYHGIGNLLPACRSCNASKNARLLYPWSVTRRLTEYARTLSEV